MTFPLPIRTAGDTAAEHVDDHNEIHGILGGGLPTGLTTSSSGHLANHNTIHTILNSSYGQSLPTSIAAGATGHLSHHSTIHTSLNEGSFIYGPSLGAQSVRDGAGARTVTNPGIGTAFTSASDLQIKINAGASGATYVAANNIDWSASVDTGAKVPKIYVPSAYTMDGGARAITGLILNGAAEVHGGNWTNFGNSGGPTFHSAIRTNGTNALVQDVVGYGNYDKVLSIRGIGATADHCTLHSNGRYGFTGSPSSGPPPYSESTRFQYLHVYGNNTNGNNPGDDAGGCKVTNTIDPYFGFNWSHDNVGVGLWTDYGSDQVTFEENVCEDNLWWGIFYEVGARNDPTAQANAIIRHNYLADNALGNATWSTLSGTSWTNGTQLLASCCDGFSGGGDGFEIYNNWIDGTANAIGFVDHASHPDDSKGCHIHDNDIWLRGSGTGRVGGSWQHASGTYPDGPDPFAAAQDNTYVDNHYHVPSGGTGVSRWRWGNGTIDSHSTKTWTQWQALGNDTGGTLVEI